MDILYLVVPCYNEEAVLNDTSKQLSEKLNSLIENKRISPCSRIVFVDDGSKDNTWDIISMLHEKDHLFQGIKLSRNQGHQNALLAGLMTVKSSCDAVISLDADLQDDIDAIDEMLDKYYDGCDIVYGVRNSRETDTSFKKKTAEGYYKAMNILGADIVYNHADFRLMSRKALDSLESFKETNMFLRGIVPMIGYKSDIVYYARKERTAGESKYPLKKMLSFAWEGITSLTTKPIRMITILGISIFFISFIMLIYSLVSYLTGKAITGWTSTIVSIWAIGGLQLFAIGIVGEYIGKVYLEAKSRPKYFIEEYLKD